MDTIVNFWGDFSGNFDISIFTKERFKKQEWVQTSLTPVQWYKYWLAQGLLHSPSKQKVLGLNGDKGTS